MADSSRKRENGMGTLIRVTVLSWAAALLTASYAGMLPKMDPTFIATVFTASAATFGVNTMKKDSEDDAKRNPEPAITAVEPTPEFTEPTVTSTEPTAGCPTCGTDDGTTDTSVPVGRV
jgi:hypothetical protein